MSFSQKVKARFKEAVKFINQFEQTAADLAVDKNYQYVICGHIHHAEIREIKDTANTGSVIYLNSGDWVESLTALEYQDGKWEIFKYNPDNFNTDTEEEDKKDTEDLNALLDVKNLLERFKHEAD